MTSLRAVAMPPVAGLYLLAASGSPRARTKIKALSVDEREAICPPALRGRSRRAFVLYGLTFEEQIERAQLPVGEEKAKGETRGKAKGEVRGGSSRDGVRDDEVRGDTDILRHGMMTSASVARRAGIDGRRFRDYLRAMGMSRQFATQRDATRAVRAFKAREEHLG